MLTLVLSFSDPKNASVFTREVSKLCKVAQDPFIPTLVRVRTHDAEVPTIKEHASKLCGKKL